METVKPVKGVNKKAANRKKSEEVIEDVNITEEQVEKDSEDGDVKYTETINLKDNKDENDNHKVNFMDEGAMENMLKNPTEESPEENKADEVKPKDGKTEDIKQETQTVEGSLSKDDMQDIADVIIDIIDMAISTGLRFYSGDSSSSLYEIDVNKKRRLVRQLANILVKYQTKFSLEFMFLLTLAICYSVPISKARKVKQQIKDGTYVREQGRPGRK